MNSFKKYGLLHILIFTVFFLVIIPEGKAQVFKNNGAPITVRPGSKLIINGNAQNAKGTIRVEGNGELRVYGNFTVNSDTVRFESSSLGMVTGSITIGSSGVVYRNTGYLTVYGAIFNSGILYNLGGIIEIGTP